MHRIQGIWECGALRRFGSRAGRGARDCEHPSAPYPPKSSDPKRRGAASSRSSRCASPAEGETPNGVNWNREGRPTEELGASRPGSQHGRAERPSSLDPSPVRLRPRLRLRPGRSPSISEAATSSCWKSCMQRVLAPEVPRPRSRWRPATCRFGRSPSGGGTPRAPPKSSTSPQMCLC